MIQKKGTLYHLGRHDQCNSITLILELSPCRHRYTETDRVMKVGTGLSLSGLVIGVVSIFLPIVGIFTGVLGLLLAALGTLFGERGLAIATVAVSIVSFVFLTPTLWMEALAHSFGYGQQTGTAPILRILVIAGLAAPIVGILLNATGKVVLGGRPSQQAARDRSDGS